MRMLKIEVCKSWRKDFKNFLKDMNLRPEGTLLARVDLSQGFSKKNCRWLTRQQIYQIRKEHKEKGQRKLRQKELQEQRKLRHQQQQKERRNINHEERYRQQMIQEKALMEEAEMWRRKNEEFEQRCQANRERAKRELEELLSTLPPMPEVRNPFTGEIMTNK